MDCTDDNWTRGCRTKLWSAMKAGRLRFATSTGPDEASWRMIFAGCFSLVVAIGIGRFAYTPTLPAMQQALDLSTPVAGALASSNNLGYLVGAAFAAFVPAGRTRGVLLRASLVIVAMSTAAVALTTSMLGWLVLRFVTGLGAAGIFVLASSAVIGALARRGKEHLTGWFYSGVGLGIALSGLAVMPSNALFDAGLAWRVDWLLLGLFAAAFVVPCWAWLPESRAAKALSGTPARGVGPDLGSGGRPPSRCESIGWPGSAIVLMPLLCAAYFLEGGGYIVTGTFLPTIVEGLPGLGGTGTAVWILVGLSAAPSTVLWARVATRTGRPAALVIAYATQSVGIALPAFSAAPWVVAASATLFGGTIVGIVSLLLPYARTVTGAGKAGFAIGSLTAVYGVGQVLGPVVGAALAGGPAGFGPALLSAAAAVALGGCLMIFVVLYDGPGRRA